MVHRAKPNRAVLVEFPIPRDPKVPHIMMERNVRDEIEHAIRKYIPTLPKDAPASQINLTMLRVKMLPVSLEHLAWIATYLRTGDRDLDKHQLLVSLHDRIGADMRDARPLGMGEVER